MRVYLFLITVFQAIVKKAEILKDYKTTWAVMLSQY